MFRGGLARRFHGVWRASPPLNGYFSSKCFMRFLIISISCLIALGCSGSANSTNLSVNNSKTGNTNSLRAAPLPVYGYEVVKAYPHDPEAFTQGLLFHNGFLYESTGEKGKSTIRKVEIETGKILQKVDLPKDNFGEGLTLLDGKLYNLTWQDGIARVYDVNDLKLLRRRRRRGRSARLRLSRL